MPEEKSLARILLLHLIVILFVILNISDIRIGGISKVVPLFDLMAVFYFTIFKNIFGIWFIFLIGIWNDALVGNVLGITSLCYILLIKIFAIVNQKMLIRENFNQIWKQFIAFCFLFLIMKWLLISVFSSHFISIYSALIHVVLNSIIYVWMHKFFDYLSQKLLGEE